MLVFLSRVFLFDFLLTTRKQLARRGIDLEDADSNKALGNQFLMEMLELREDIDAANEECDVAKLERLRVRFSLLPQARSLTHSFTLFSGSCC
jgi:hypothetical protein